MSEQHVARPAAARKAGQASLKWPAAALISLTFLGLAAAIVANLFAVQSANARIDDLELRLTQTSQRLTEVETAAGAASSAATDASSEADYALTRAEEIAECVNDYMKTVGDAAGGRYRYYYC